MDEETQSVDAAKEYIRRQTKFNEDIIKAVDRMNKALQLQAKLNTETSSMFHQIKISVDSHKNLIMALTIWSVVTTTMLAISIING